MPFVQAKCENCGSLLSVDSSLKAANCPNCGTAYIVQDAINYYNSVTNVEHLHADSVTISADDSSEGKIKAAEGYMMLGKYYEAYSVYRAVRDLIPQDYRGWWGMIEAATNRLDPQKEPQIKDPSENSRIGDRVLAFKQLDDCAVSVKKLAPPTIGEQLLNSYLSYRSAYLSNKNVEMDKTNESRTNSKREIERLDKRIQQMESEKEHLRQLSVKPSKEFYNAKNRQKEIREGRDNGTRAFSVMGGVFSLLLPIGLIMLLFTKLGIIVALLGIVIPFIGYFVGVSKSKYDKQQLELKSNNYKRELDEFQNKEEELNSKISSLWGKKREVEYTITNQSDTLKDLKGLIDYLTSTTI